MQATATLQAFSAPPSALDESIQSLLHQKQALSPHGKKIFSIGPEQMVYQAVKLMSQAHIGCLPVLVGGRLVGIISERDYARKVVLMGRNSHITLVGEIMTTQVLFVTPDHRLGEAMSMMTTHRVRHLPVMTGDDVIGIVSIGDVVRCLVDSQDQTIHALTQYISGTYPG